jgi:predicted aminopeptidase
VHLNELSEISLRAICKCVLAGLLLLQLAGCSAGYYWQAAEGQLRIINGREDIDTLLEDPALAPDLRARLKLTGAALDFAHGDLLLPDNGSYRSYFDTGSDYVVWNVFAAPEFSLEPLNWCFPVAGCVSYRGYFDALNAEKFAAKLEVKGNDIFVAGVPAYSTLGRFKDPVLNTMLAMSAEGYVGLLFHELAHQRIYVQDDSAFNEGFAAAVERIGLARWQPAGGAVSALHEQQRRQVLELLKTARKQLDAVYAGNMTAGEMRAAKAAILTTVSEDYRTAAVGWQAAGSGYRPYGRMIMRGLNNASLSAVATYADYAPAFVRIYRECTESISCFYERVEQLADLSAAERIEKLAAYMNTEE